MKNIYYVGLPKCASTWLYTQLFKYSSGNAVVLRDIHFFDLYYENGITWYNNLFGTQVAERADITHDYILYEKALKRISLYDKNAYAIYHYRDPFELINSLYAETKAFGFEYFIEHGFDKPYTKSEFLYSKLSKNILSYSLHIKNLHKYFNPSQLSIADTESILKNSRNYLYYISKHSGFQLNLDKYRAKEVRPGRFTTNIFFKALLPTFGKLSRLMRQHRFMPAKYIARIKRLTAKSELILPETKHIPTDNLHKKIVFDRDEVYSLFLEINNISFVEFKAKVQTADF